MSELIEDEVILNPTNRISAVPLDPKYADIWKNYLAQRNTFWTDDKVNFVEDVKHFPNIPKNIQESTKKTLGYFAGSDDLVEEIIAKSKLSQITVPEIRTILNYEEMMENIHANTYNKNIIAYIADKEEREHLFHSIQNIPSVKHKAEWASQWITDTRKIDYTIIGKSCVEAINFSASFAFIDWLKSRKYKLPGLFFANEEISRDERRHVVTSVLIHKIINDKLTSNEAKEIIDGALKVEYEFIDDVIPIEGYIGLNRDMMKQHVLHCAYKLAVELGYPNMFKQIESPFDFIVALRGFETKANFFERDSASYVQPENNDNIFDENDDF